METAGTQESDRSARRDESRYRALFDMLGDGVIAWNADGSMLTCNRRASEILGRPLEQLQDLRLDELLRMAEHDLQPIGPDGAPRPRSTFPAIVASQHRTPVLGQVLSVLRPDGTRVWLEVDVRPVDDPRGGASLISSFRDITSTKVAQDRLEFQAKLLAAVGQAVVASDRDGKVLYFNEAAELLFDLPADEALGQFGGDLITPLPTAENAAAISESMSQGRTWTGYYRLQRHDGVELTVFVTNTPVMDDAGRLDAVISIASDVSELVAARDAVVRSEERFRSLVQYASDVALVLDAEGTITYASPAVERFGYVPEDLVGRPSRDLVHPEDVDRQRQSVLDAMALHGTVTLEWRIRFADGSYRWAEEIITDMRDVPAIGGFVANMRDITDRKQAEAERVQADERFRHGFERSAFGLAILDVHHCCTSANSALTDLLGYPVEQLRGRRPLEFIHPAEAPIAREGVERLLLRNGPPHYKREHRMVRADGSLVWVLIDMTLVRDAQEEPSYYFVQVRDITDRKHAEAALEHQALHDDLTHLPNRLLLVDRLSHSLARADRTGGRVAVFFLDVDRFKLVNDGLGHVVGDQLLVEVAQRLQDAIRGSDTVARFGGDEFVVVREDVQDVDEAAEFGERIAAALHEPVGIPGRELYVTASIGVAIGGKGFSAEQLLRDADAAMYRAKDLGRARIELFSHELQRTVSARLDLETALHQAIDRDELELLYQPIVRLADGRVVGAEALLRWQREGGEVVMPAEFIPVAEDTGLIVPIGTWALEHALTEVRALTRLHDAGDWPLLAVNLSALQLRLPASIDMVRNAIDVSGVDPAMLSLEITESAVMDDIETSARAMAALRDLGVQLAVDDFGTGYSSLAYLKRLPVDALKIDRSFIDGLPSDIHDRSITQAIITLGKSLGLTIVAEGVETVEQWIALDELGCSVGQGFLWSAPVPASAFASMLTGLQHPRRDAPSTPGQAVDAN